MRRSRSQTAIRRAETRRGFTLIEVLLVLIILVIIGSLAANIFTGTQEQASINAARSNLTILRSPIERYQLDMNKPPTKLADLWEKPSDSKLSEKWGGPYVQELKPDPWENEYQYLAEGKKNADSYDIWSNGPDGKSGTDDDIGNWK